ncbi:Rpn family recombination-promoting nuclease/putative transposase [Tumebacillus sp. DT12]|uniref:Rpn family recombination-promoting nuclease/putative transposase n=1 Tax=Tumebacillus lacus TaxID=2995335 RepID=A0ABT3X2A3_9BACL|nr:Rpn family recombination-promoting nuclease/putative transposase [Tumebacillus lacus]MCX7571040.1 Rpn family recombination-promoting nuclease/putative transposase [Tumebacillus lacus]
MTADLVMKPTNDLVFKALFGQDSSRSFLQSLLESILQTGITNLSIVDPVIKIQDVSDKSPILDIKVLTAENEYINIEIQVAKQTYFSNRSLYYWARIYGSQLAEGESYTRLKRAICINFLDFRFFPDLKFHSAFQIQESKTGLLLTDHFEMHFIELPKFGYAKEEVLQEKNLLYQWIYFIKYADKLSVEDVRHMSEPIRNAYGKLVTLSADETLRLRIISQEIGRKDQQQRMQDLIDDAQLDGRKEEAIETLREWLFDFHGLDLSPYEQQIRRQSLEKIRELRQGLRKDKSLVIRDLESL